MRISKIFFYTLVFLLPITTAKVFFSDQSFFYGYHIFYHTSWLYLTDYIFGGLMLVWLWENKSNISFGSLSTAIKEDFLYRSTLVFWLILAISTSISRETLLSSYGFLRFTEYLLIFVYVRENIRISREMLVIFWLILATSLLQAAFGIAQYLSQSSIGLKILGESVLGSDMKGVAVFISQGIGSWQNISRLPAREVGEMLIMRAYATLPHPNMLAVLLFVGLFANLWLIYTNISQKHDKYYYISREMLLIFSLVLLGSGLVLTFSRAVWFVTLLSLLAIFVVIQVVKRRLFERMRSGQRVIGERYYFPKRIALILGVLFLTFLLNWLLFGEQIRDRLVGRGEGIFSEQESFVDRQRFASVSREMIVDNPIFGVGLRNFVARMDEYNTGERLLPHQHQPVHNIYLLLAAEIGFVGLAIFLLIVIYIVRHGIMKIKAWDRGERVILLTVFLGFLFLGLFDHYFVSIHQSALLFWITAGIIASK